MSRHYLNQSEGLPGSVASRPLKGQQSATAAQSPAKRATLSVGGIFCFCFLFWFFWFFGFFGFLVFWFS
jgi:hypothetical protein